MEKNTNQKDEEEAALPKEERRESIITQKVEKGMNAFEDVDANEAYLSSKVRGWGEGDISDAQWYSLPAIEFCVRSFLILRPTVDKRHRHSHSIHSTHITHRHTQTHAYTTHTQRNTLMQNTQHTTDTPRTQQTRPTPFTQHPLLCFTQQCLTQHRAQWMTTQRTHLQAPTRHLFLWPFSGHSHLRPLKWPAHLQQRAQWIRICTTCCHPLNTSSSRFLYGTSTCCDLHSTVPSAVGGTCCDLRST